METDFFEWLGLFLDFRIDLDAFSFRQELLLCCTERPASKQSSSGFTQVSTKSLSRAATSDFGLAFSLPSMFRRGQVSFRSPDPARLLLWSKKLLVAFIAERMVCPRGRQIEGCMGSFRQAKEDLPVRLLPSMSFIFVTSNLRMLNALLASTLPPWCGLVSIDRVRLGLFTTSEHSLSSSTSLKNYSSSRHQFLKAVSSRTGKGIFFCQFAVFQNQTTSSEAKSTSFLADFLVQTSMARRLQNPDTSSSPVWSYWRTDRSLDRSVQLGTRSIASSKSSNSSSLVISSGLTARSLLQQLMACSTCWRLRSRCIMRRREDRCMGLSLRQEARSFPASSYLHSLKQIQPLREQAYSRSCLRSSSSAIQRKKEMTRLASSRAWLQSLPLSSLPAWQERYLEQSRRVLLTHQKHIIKAALCARRR